MENSAQPARVSKSEKTKMRISDAYFELMFGKEWDRITVKEVCEKAGITRGTFYQYFNDIYDIVDQEETALLRELSERYGRLPLLSPGAPPQDFDREFNCEPPARLVEWFDFCMDHKKTMAALLDRQYGDHYFVKRLKELLQEHIVAMMDSDGHPNDELRAHFVSVFLELHFMAALAWLEQGEEDFLSTSQIVTLLNTMRVGANYLSYRQRCTPGLGMVKALHDSPGACGTK